MGGRRLNRCFTGISAGIMALMIAACAETSVGGMPSPTGNLAAQSDSESAANAKAGNTTQSAASAQSRSARFHR